MCNGHASDCEYNTTQSSVVCLNCMDNTTGDNCELCLPRFYQDQSLLLNDLAICAGEFYTLSFFERLIINFMHFFLIACDCSQAGIVDDGLCDGRGQCNCKANVDNTTLSCGQCRDGYWNLTDNNPDGCQGITLHIGTSLVSGFHPVGEGG